MVSTSGFAHCPRRYSTPGLGKWVTGVLGVLQVTGVLGVWRGDVLGVWRGDRMPTLQFQFQIFNYYLLSQMTS